MENVKLITHLWTLPFEQKVEYLENQTAEAREALDEALKPYMSEHHYTRGQDVEVYTGNYVNTWQKALYITKIIGGMHLVFIDKTGQLGQFPDTHIRQITQTTEDR